MTQTVVISNDELKVEDAQKSSEAIAAFLEQYVRVDLSKAAEAVRQIDEEHSAHKISVENLASFIKENGGEFSPIAKDFFAAWLEENAKLAPNDRRLQTSIIEAKVMLNYVQAELDHAHSRTLRMVARLYEEVHNEKRSALVKLMTEYQYKEEDYKARVAKFEQVVKDTVASRLQSMNRLRRFLLKFDKSLIRPKRRELEIAENVGYVVGGSLTVAGGGMLAWQLYTFLATATWPKLPWLTVVARTVELMASYGESRRAFLGWANRPDGAFEHLHTLLTVIPAQATLLLIGVFFLRRGMTARDLIKRKFYVE